MSNAAPENLPAQPSDIPVPPTATTEGLPEYEPLTPEMVEDEAVRGDFVMKWAVILLAVLFACTLIVDTSTLVHTKTGQYLATHGFLPPAHDVFSSSATDRPWINLAWLFDLVLSVAYGAGSAVGIGGFVGLSILKAILAGLAFGFVAHTSRPGVSTWWGSICAALAVLVCQPRFTAQPEIVTLLGIGLILWLLHGWLWNLNSRRIWMTVPVCILWANLDDRAWWGPFLLLLYGIGEYLGKAIHRPAVASSSQRKTMWLAIAGCCVGLLANPSGPRSWFAPGTLLGIYYPALRAYSPARLEAMPLTMPQLWIGHPVVLAAALLLFVTAGALIVINRRRVDFGHVVLFFGAAIPAFLIAHELGAAAMVFCVVATLNGQSWYAATAKREYSTETRALLFSRGGRAVTVLVLFTLALLFTVGRLRPTGTGTVGLGLDPDLEGTINSYQTVLDGAIDDRPFNFTLEQGDVLIWNGQKPYIDQRLPIFAGTQDSSLILRHQHLRLALSPKGKTPGAKARAEERKFWQDEFNRLQITHCMPRLGGNNPDYPTFSELLGSPDWQFVHLGSATAVFYRRDLEQPELKAFLAKNQFDFGDSAFKKESELLPPRAGWAQLPTFYQRYIWQTNVRTSAEVREARHLVGLAGMLNVRGVGLIFQAIRRAQEGLAKNQNDAAAYEILGRAYALLLNLEARGQMSSQVGQLRYLQAVESFNLALVAAPDNPEVHQMLFQLYTTNNRADLAYREISALYDWLSVQKTDDPEQENAQIQQLEQAAQHMDRISKYITQIETQAEKLPKEVREQPMQLAGFYIQNGMTLKALELLQPADDEVTQPTGEMGVRADLLLEAGRVEEAYELAGQLEVFAQQSNVSDWQRPRVATLLANAEYTLAAGIWTRQASDAERDGAAGVLRSLVPRHYGAVGRPWPLGLTEAATQYFFSTPNTTSSLNVYAALIYLEAGQIKRATEIFRLALKQNPNHPERALLSFYLGKLTGQWVDFIPPADRVPIEFAE